MTRSPSFPMRRETGRGTSGSVELSWTFYSAGGVLWDVELPQPSLVNQHLQLGVLRGQLASRELSQVKKKDAMEQV
eukprot:CAMPEP_0185746242 /NCGR_PEP_ID=MMETSP1174-20130828/4736_1 /TAXON_ID=35687 /ORGANISM="Dictyocha speculum, Strain CCMP1381" /LENGTH=75 /DNA_ID=CAMNT_0028420765 /DNA_START=79 /DNA_END=306 /DNA_ORIENTATION=+